MKRVVSLILVVLMLATLLCACAETYVCDFCGQEVTQKPVKLELLGEQIKVCDECKTMIEQLGDMFG